MKKLFSLLAAMLLPLMANAYDLEDKGIFFNVKGDGTLVVVGLDAGTTIADILSDVTIGGKTYQVTSIGERAFEGRSDITYLSIPWSVTSIGEYAFRDCGSNISVNIADPECWCQMELGNEHASPLSSAGKVLVHDIETTTIDIPETVTSIGKFTFYQCRKITSLNIPSSVKSIGSSAFEDCTGLTSLTLSEGLQSVGGSAFEGCTGLKSLIIPSTVNSISMNAFRNCKAIADVYCYAQTVPNTDDAAFDGTPTESATLHVPSSAVGAYKASWPWSDFKEIVAIGSSETISGKCGANVNYSYDKVTRTLTISGEGMMDEYTYGNLPWSSFANEILWLNIESGVSGISYAAFADCTGLTTVTIPNSVTFIAPSVFKGCTDLVSVTLPDILKSDLFYTFYGCSSLSSIIVPEGVESIDYYSFSECKALTSVILPTTLKSIGLYAFSGCSSLTSIDIPEGVTGIGGFGFSNCSSLATVIFRGVTNLGEHAFNECGNLRNVYCYSETLPETDEPFMHNTPIELATLHVPENAIETYRATWPWSDFKEIVAIGDGGSTTLTDKGIIFALKGDGTLEVIGLEAVTKIADILSEVTIEGKEYQVTSIGARAFEGRSDIEYLSIPWSIKSIGEYAFIDCGSSMTVNIADPESWCKMELGNEHSSPLSSAGKVLVFDKETDYIDIPETVTSIGKFTFYQCRCITSLNIPSSVKSIGSSAFEDCTGLTALVLGEGLETIGGSAFEGCSGLQTLTIPSTVKTISVNAFRNCKGITDVYCYAENVPETDSDVFDATPTESATLHVPANAVEAYRSSWPWSDFKEIVAIGEEGPDAIMGVKHSDDGNTEYYNLTGRKVHQLQKGLNILRYKDGTMKKIIVK